LIKDLQNAEGVPTDSESLEQAFHSHGINMRYLGTVANELKSKELNHLKILLEREVVMRSAKHIFNEHIRESSDTYLSSVISHLFNILLAPFPFID
jgi:protein TIF31